MWHGETPWQAIEESTYLLDTALNKDGEIRICRAQFIPQNLRDILDIDHS